MSTSAFDLRNDPFYLSASNPVANKEQIAMEDAALQLLDHPAVKRARAGIDIIVRNAMAWPAADQMSAFDEAMDEYAFNFVLRALSSDGEIPRPLRLMQPAHQWFGRNIPGSRWGGDSPDFVYRHIAISHGGKYVIHVQPLGDDPPSITFTLMKNMPLIETLGIIDSLDIVREEGGGFDLTIDNSPANGRPNHIQTTPGDMHLLIRDALGDWMRQTPSALKVERLNPPSRAVLSHDELAREASRQLMQSIYYVYYCTQSGAGQAPNQLRSPTSSAPFGGMATQWGTKGNIVLEPDEAMIVTANAAGATFRNTSLCDLFFRTVDYWSKTGTLNMNQMAPDEDGKFTYVVAHQDPGVHNWLDTGGRRRTIYGHRWQAFERGRDHDDPQISSKVVKFSDIDRILGSGVQRISADGRREQIAMRSNGFMRRFLET